jgi:hypothetical protein
MAILVQLVSIITAWMGLLINMKKSFISAVDVSSGQIVATDSITYRGSCFPVLHPDQAFKRLGLRITLTGDFKAEKAHVLKEMQARIELLAVDKVLSPSLKELLLTTGITSVFRYSAGLVPWTRAELLSINQLWLTAYKRIWHGTAARGIDGTPLLLDEKHGGRSCPSAVDVWTRDALGVLEQCLLVPGEISQIVLHQLKQTCHDHGCVSLNQLQRVLRLNAHARAHTVIELLMIRLDEQGLEISSPWEPEPGELIVEAVWPFLWNTWSKLQKWV